jgi:hypothetical protein
LIAVGIAAAFLSDFVGAFGLALLGALISAFALQGLAFIHDTSRARSGRTFFLIMVYLLALLVSSIAMPLLAILGLADVAFHLRNRVGSGPAGPRLPST